MFPVRAGLIFSAFIFLLACEKDDPIPSRVQLLARTDWKLQEFTSTPAYPITINGTVTNFTDLMSFYRTYNTCFLNQGFHFSIGNAADSYEKGLYTYYEADKSCSQQAVRDTGRWFFQTNSTEMLLWRAFENNTSNLKSSYVINQVSFSTLRITSKVRLVTNGPVYELKRTFVPTR